MNLYHLNLYRPKMEQPRRGPITFWLDRSPKKWVATATLVSIFVLVTAINANVTRMSNLNFQGSQSGTTGRGIASVEERNGAVTEDKSLESKSRSWLQRLAKSPTRQIELGETSVERGIASLGENPSKMDELRFGLLEGKYAIRIRQGMLREIEFSESESESDRPKYIASPEEFLRTYQGLHQIKFETALKVGESSDGTLKTETYELRGEPQKDQSDGIVRGRAHFQTDNYGRFRNLKMTEAP